MTADPRTVASARALADPDPWVRRGAAVDLAGIGADLHRGPGHGPDDTGCRFVVEQLAARIAAEPDPTALHAVLKSLTAIGCGQAVAALLPHLRGESAAMRTAVVDALSQIEATELVIEDLLADDDADVRVRAVTLLGQMPTRSGVGWLATLISADADPRVVGSAVGELMARDDVQPASKTDLCGQASQRFPRDPYLKFLLHTASTNQEASS